MFELEALKAKHGDCLLLHWGDDESRHLALIDGGPNTVYKSFLAPRLKELAGGPRGAVALDLLMLSHIDDDHINGLLDLGEAIIAGRSPVSIDLLWFNSLEGLLDGELPGGGAAQATASVRRVFRPHGTEADAWEEKVLASVPQGQELGAIAAKLGLDETMNWPYNPLVMCGLEPRSADIRGLKLTPVAPRRDAVEALRKVWREKSTEGATAAYKDRSPYNLSSIVVVAEYDGKTMLLTGDALGRDVIEGLDALHYPKRDGSYHFDVLKLPHHGSQNNVTKEFFETISADRYVVSGDHEKFPNPHEDAMGWLAAARDGADYAVYCTYPLTYMAQIFGDRLVVPSPAAFGVTARVS